MDKNQFIQWLIVKFMSNADERQAEVAFKDFESILSDDLDFNFLKVSILTNYDKRSIPDYNYMKQYFRKKTSNIGNAQWTPSTWEIYGKTRDGRVYAFAYYMGVTEAQGREMFLKERPELEYAGNNREEVLNRIRTEKKGV